MAAKRWADLSTKAKVGIVGVAAVDAGLRAWALRDLAGRTDAEINGPKWAWAAGLALLSTSGVLPALYLASGRR